jgi:hypothetical protein
VVSFDRGSISGRRSRTLETYAAAQRDRRSFRWGGSEPPATAGAQPLPLDARVVGALPAVESTDQHPFHGGRAPGSVRPGCSR